MDYHRFAPEKISQLGVGVSRRNKCIKNYPFENMKTMRNFLVLMLSAFVFINSSIAAGFDNFSEYYKQDCKFVAGKTTGANDWCNRGNAEGKQANVVVIGDSYSNSFTTVLEELASEKNSKLVYEQYGHGQCPGLLNYGPQDWCASFAKGIFERVKRNKSVKVVMLISHWPYYFSKDWKWNESKLVYTQEQTAKALSETIAAYQGIGKRVVFIYSAPLMGNPKVCAERRISISAAEDQCKITKGMADATKYYRPFVDPILVKQKVEVFDPYVYLCDDTGCKVRDGRKIFSASQAHFSGFGGQYLARKAAPELKKLLQF